MEIKNFMILGDGDDDYGDGDGDDVVDDDHDGDGGGDDNTVFEDNHQVYVWTGVHSIQDKKHSRNQFAATFLDSVPQFALAGGIQDFHVTERQNFRLWALWHVTE